MAEKEKISYSTSFSGVTVMSGNITWQMSNYGAYGRDGECIKINFPMYSYTKERHAFEWLKESLKRNNIDWINFEKGKWLVDINKLYSFFSNAEKHDWAEGIVEPIVEVEHEDREVFGKTEKETAILFTITEREVFNSMTKKLFLSHKGVDKPIVREFFNTFNSMGFSPWLDEDAMVAGVPLERALLDGMKESCAAVFFVTPEYLDENYLATEIDYAMAEKRNKGDRFSIITLVFSDEDGNKGEVPELLKQYVWKEPNNHLEALREIIRALPIETQSIEWK